MSNSPSDKYRLRSIRSANVNVSLDSMQYTVEACA